MISFKTAAAGLVVTVALAGPAFAQSQGSSSPQATQTMGGMKDMKKGSDMSGMSMDQQMAHCAEMRAQMKQGKPMSADMQKMLKECDDMDRQMHMPMPGATKSR
jgi:hypothetical protein